MHIAIPGPARLRLRSVQNRTGNGASPLLERQRLLSFWCLEALFVVQRSPSLTSFLPLTSHARVICGENGFVHQKHLKNKRTARSPKKGIRFAQPENDLEGNLSFRFNPPTPHFNSSLFLSVIHVLQAGQKHGQRAGRVVKPVRKFPGRKFFYGNRKKILLGKTVTLMKVTAPCPDWLLLPTCWPALRARPLCCM